MLIDISQKSVDEEKLINAVREFEIEHNQNAYIFINKETFNELLNNSSLIHYQATDDYNGVVGAYRGIRVYNNEDLKFGEVEIR